jgi:hypothetical protein
MRTLLVAVAEPVELRGLLRRLGPWRRLDWPVDFARQTEHRGGRWIAAANGAGPRLAGRTVALAAERVKLDAVVSAGFCGALDESLEPGAVYVAGRVFGPEAAAGFEAGLPRTSRPYMCGSMISIDRFVAAAAEKRRLRVSGAGAVEMEAAGVAREAVRRGVPFFCVRVVTDTAGESFAFDWNAVRDGDGRFCRRRLLWQALRRPLVVVPELAFLFRRSRAAAETLGEFLADCEF